MSKKILTTALFSLTILSYPFSANGEVVRWVQNGSAVSNSPAHKLFPAITGDGSDGAYVVWEDYSRDLTKGDIFVQNIDVNGTPVFSSDKDVTKDNTAAKRFPAIVKAIEDGSVYAYVVWEDDGKVTTNGTDIHIQKINADGTGMWSEDKVVCDATGDQWVPQIALTTNGDVIVVWEDRRGPVPQIYAQMLDKDGAPVDGWTVNGIALAPTDYNQLYPAIAPDGDKGAVIVWEDQRDFVTTESNIYGQRLNSSGVRQWGAAGKAITNSDENQWFPAIATNGGSFVITWEDYQNGGIFSDIYAKGVDANGDPLLGFDEKEVCVDTDLDQRFPRIAYSTAEDSFIIAWEDYRNDQENFTADIYAQKIDITGIIKWTANGEPVSTEDDSQDLPSITSSDTKGVIAVWEDFRSGSFYDIYALQLPIFGSLKINSDGVNTVDPDVTLTLSVSNINSSAIITEVCISNETSACPDSDWQPYPLADPSWTLDVAPGTKKVYAKFKDDGGNISPSYFDEIILGPPPEDIFPPTSVITSPTDSSTISGTSYTIRGTASDVGSWVTKVVVSIDGGAWLEANGTTSWTYTWSPLTEGPHTIKAKATDAAGLESTEAVITVTVVPSAPTTLTISMDGLNIDQAFSYSNIIASWSPGPPGSTYEVGIGSGSNAADVVNWTANGNRTSYFNNDLQTAFETYKASNGEYFGKTFYLNIRVSGTVISSQSFVYTPADISSKSGTNDGRVDGFDLGMLGIAFGGTTGGAADINRDGKVDGNDLIILGTNFGKVKP